MSDSSSAPVEVPVPAEPAARAKSTGLVSIAIFSSRIMGLIRDMLLSHCFDKQLRDCFIAAFRIPNMLRDLFAEGALSTAFVTVFSQKMKTEGDQPAWNLAHKMLTLATIFMSGISLLGVLLSGPLVRLMAGGTNGWSEGKLQFTTTLTQIMFPFILLVSLAALVMGMLNAKRVFGAPAMASTYFNIVSIVFGLGLGWVFDHAMGGLGMVWFSIGTLLGGLAQLVSQFPALRKLSYRFRWDAQWRQDPAVQRILKLMWPAIIAGSAVQVNVFLNSVFATHVAGDSDGPVAWLSNAFRLMQLPLGIFGVAVATVTLPVISRATTDGITEKFRSAMGAGNRLVLFLCLPSAIGLMLLAVPIISLIFEHGKFSAAETLKTASALQFYAIGLVFYSLIKVIQPAFTAINRRFIPMAVAILSIVINASLSTLFVFVWKMPFQYLALSTAIVAAVNCLILYASLNKISAGLENAKLVSTLLRLLLPILALVSVCLFANHTILEHERWQQWHLALRLTTLLVTVGAGAGVYFTLASLLKVDEARQFTGMLERKLRRK
jgi:putative peptidoglycan lipid II flippase